MKLYSHPLLALTFFYYLPNCPLTHLTSLEIILPPSPCSYLLLLPPKLPPNTPHPSFSILLPPSPHSYLILLHPKLTSNTPPPSLLILLPPSPYSYLLLIPPKNALSPIPSLPLFQFSSLPFLNSPIFYYLPNCPLLYFTPPS